MSEERLDHTAAATGTTVSKEPQHATWRPPAVGQFADKRRGYPLTVAFAAVAAALGPAYVVRGHLGPLPTTALEVAILATLAVFVFESVRVQRWPDWRSPVTIPAAVFLVAGAISVLDAPSRVAALGVYRAYFIEPIAFALALVTALRTTRQAYMVLLGFGAGATVLAVANSLVVLRAIQAHTLSGRLAPPVAIYPVGNMVALYLMPLAALAAGIALSERQTRIRVVSAVFAAVAALAVLLAFSRGGWAALVVVAGTLAASARRRWLWLGALLVSGVALALIPPIAARIAADLRDSTLDGRTPLWAQSLRMLAARPLLGAGLSGFQTRMEALGGTYQVTLNFPHNIVLNFWSETGVLGLAAFATIFVIVTVVSWRGRRHGPAEWQPIQFGVLLALLAILIHGLVDNPYFKNDLSLEFWAIVALALAGRNAARYQDWSGYRPLTSADEA